MRQLSHNVSNSIETIHWYEAESVSNPVNCNILLSNCSKSSSTSYDNPPILQSIYPILDSLNINTSNLNKNPFDVISLNNPLSEISCVLTDNNINIREWGSREKKRID